MKSDLEKPEEIDSLLKWECHPQCLPRTQRQGSDTASEWWWRFGQQGEPWAVLAEGIRRRVVQNASLKWLRGSWFQEGWDRKARCCCSVAKLHPILYNPMDWKPARPHPSSSPRICSSSCSLNWSCYPTISSKAHIHVFHSADICWVSLIRDYTCFWTQTSWVLVKTVETDPGESKT